MSGYLFKAWLTFFRKKIWNCQWQICTVQLKIDPEIYNQTYLDELKTEFSKSKSQRKMF